MKTKFLFFFPH